MATLIKNGVSHQKNHAMFCLDFCSVMSGIKRNIRIVLCSLNLFIVRLFKSTLSSSNTSFRAFWQVNNLCYVTTANREVMACDLRQRVRSKSLHTWLWWNASLLSSTHKFSSGKFPLGQDEALKMDKKPPVQKTPTAVAVEWMSTTTCHGVAELVKPAASVFTRVFWTVVMLLALYFGAWQVVWGVWRKRDLLLGASTATIRARAAQHANTHLLNQTRASHYATHYCVQCESS